MLKLANGNTYKLIYLDTNAISDLSKNHQNCFKKFFEKYNFFETESIESYALVTTVYNLYELNRTRSEYKNKIIKIFDLIPVLICNGFPQIVNIELNKDDFILFATGAKPLFNNQFSTLFNMITNLDNNDKIFKSNLEKEIKIWNTIRKKKDSMIELFSSSYQLYNKYNYDYNILYSANSSKLFSYIKYHFLYEKSHEIDNNSIIDTYNACISTFVDVYIGERTVTSWLEKSKHKYNFMSNVECIKISEFYDKK